MTRRNLLMNAMSAFLRRKEASNVSVAGYIFEQYAVLRQKALESLIAEAVRYASAAGFQNIELGPGFFTPELRGSTLNLLRSNGLALPSAYVGGILHEKASAEKTIAQALEIGRLCGSVGCRAIVNNPDPKQGEAEKNVAELVAEAESLNRMGRLLAREGLQLRVHHHTPQLVNNAREWRFLLKNTDPEYVFICVDIDWAYEGGFEPVPFLREVGPRLREIHVRSAKNKVWLEDLEDSDIDYRKVAAYLKSEKLEPLIVVELAYRAATSITRGLQEDLAISRRYVKTVFGV